MKKILITGGAGFVGSNLAIHLKENLSDKSIICYDNLSRRGSTINVDRLKDNHITFIKGDIRDKEQLFKITGIDCVIDCAAEPSVIAAHKEPASTIDTNLMGTVNALELARREDAAFIFLSTSRVYPIEKLENLPFEELPTRFDWKKDISDKGFSYSGIGHDFPLTGSRSLYGATKLCSEILTIEYFHNFGIKGVINRLGLIAGPWQMGKIDQGLIGFWLSKHKYNGSLDFIGYGGLGKQVRDAIHIDDVCDLILKEISEIDRVHTKIYNVGGGRSNSFSLSELTTRIQEITQTKIPVGSVTDTRTSDIRIYITDNSHINNDFGWRPQKSLDDILSDTNQWIDDNYNDLKNILA